MTEKERLEWIAEVAGAVQQMSCSLVRAILWYEQINRCSEGIRLVAMMSDMFVDTNVNQIDQIRAEAKIVYKELTGG